MSESHVAAAVAAAGAELHGVLVLDIRAPVVLDPDHATLFVGIVEAADLVALARLLAGAYPPGHAVTVVSRPGASDQRVVRLTVADLARAQDLPGPMSVWAPAPPPEQRSTVTGLRAIMARLRGPDGCPWDREQDHRTLRRCLLEEAHETLDAIDREDWPELAVELGDVLLQVVFHAQLAAERGDFGFDDVVAHLHEKLVARHPHVFGDAVAETAGDVLRRWDELKRVERATAGHTDEHDLLAGVAPTLPALERAQKVQRRATHFGFDWPEIAGPLDKLQEEIAELRAEVQQAGPGSASVEHEMGDLLFAAVNVARFAGVDAEQTLRVAVDRFARRFALMRQLADAQGESWEAMNLEQMDAWWNRAKDAHRRDCNNSGTEKGA